MQSRRQRLLCLLVVWVLNVGVLAGCIVDIPLPDTIPNSAGESIRMPEYPLYVLGQTIMGPNRSQYNELVIVDPDTWSVVRRIPLPKGTPWSIDRDPQGRIWVGYATMAGSSDSRVAVVSSEGELEQVLRPCGDPSYGIHFSDTHAFVPCRMNGFFGQVSVVDLQDLAVTQTIEPQYEEKFSLTASGSGNGKLLLFGGGETKNWLALVDTQTFTITETLTHPFSNINDVVYHAEQFYLLNKINAMFPEKSEALLHLTLSSPSTLEEIHLPGEGATWGTIAEDQLYVYQNPRYGTTSSSPLRFISRLDLTTGETESWSLPDWWNAGDIAWVNGKLILSYRRLEDPEQTSGLYEFNPETGELTQLLHLPGAELLLPTGP